MKARRIFRPSRKTAQERVQEQTLREKLQQDRPSLEDLVRAGACDPDAVMTMGMYFDVQRALHDIRSQELNWVGTGMAVLVVPLHDQGDADKPLIERTIHIDLRHIVEVETEAALPTP